MKILFMISILTVITSCTTLSKPTQTELWAQGEATKYSGQAHIDYFKCSFEWPNAKCLQENWDRYGAPEIKSLPQEERKIKALAYIKAMEMQGAAKVLRKKHYPCQEIRYLDDMLFSKSKHAVCDAGEYKIKTNGKDWEVIGM